MIWKFLKQNVLFPKDLNWVQRWVSRIGLLGAKRLKIILKTSQKPTIHVHFGRLIRPFMHSRSSKQANDITLIENDVVITDKKELAELFNNYFVHIVDDVQDIKKHNFGNEFSAHPSIRATAEENRRKNAIHNFDFKYTNKTQVEKLLSNINPRKACGHDTITQRLLNDIRFCDIWSTSKVNEWIDQTMQISFSMENGVGYTSFQEKWWIE